MASSKRLTRLVETVIAAAGGDAKAVHLPDTKRPLTVQLQRRGNRLMILCQVDSEDPLPKQAGRPTAYYLSQGLGETLVRGVVLNLREERWLAMNGGWSAPLVAPREHPGLLDVLEGYHGAEIALWGIFTDEGLVVTRFAASDQMS